MSGALDGGWDGQVTRDQFGKKIQGQVLRGTGRNVDFFLRVIGSQKRF